MTRETRLVLSGGTVSDRFFEAAFALAETKNPHVLVDLSALPKSPVYQVQREFYDDYFRTTWDIEPRFLQDETGRLKHPRAIGQLLRYADIFYSGDGSLRRLLKSWDGYVADAAYERVKDGKMVAAGVGEGALPWFDTSQSGYRQYDVLPGMSWRLMPLQGLGLVDAVATAHHDSHDSMGRLRSHAYKAWLTRQENWYQALGIDAHAALVCRDGVCKTAALTRRQPAYQAKPAVHLYRPDEKPMPFFDGETVPLV